MANRGACVGKECVIVRTLLSTSSGQCFNLHLLIAPTSNH